MSSRLDTTFSILMQSKASNQKPHISARVSGKLKFSTILKTLPVDLKLKFLRTCFFGVIAAVLDLSVLALIARLLSDTYGNSWLDLNPSSELLQGRTFSTLMVEVLGIFALIISSSSLRIYNIRRNSSLSALIAASIAATAFKGQSKNVAMEEYSYKLKSIVNMFTIQTTQVMSYCIYPALQLTTLVTGLVVILIWLISSNPLISSLVFLTVVLSYAIIASTSKKTIKKNSSRILASQRELMDFTRYIFEDRKSIAITGPSPALVQKFHSLDLSLKTSSALTVALVGVPRVYIESLIFLIIAFLYFGIVVFNFDKSFLFMIGIAGLKIVPYCQQLYSSFVNFKTFQPVLENLLAMIDQVNQYEDLTEPCTSDYSVISNNLFHSSAKSHQTLLEAKSIAVNYGNKYIAQNLSLSLGKNQKIAIIGPSGSGKSTLIDSLIGMKHPSKGCVFYKGQALYRENNKQNIDLIRLLHSNLSYMGQVKPAPSVNLNSYIFDKSFRGHVNIPKDKILSIADDLGIYEIVHDIIFNSSDYNFDQLSGGQQQRLSLLATFVDASERSLLILDEPTSALDPKTSYSVMQYITSMEKSVIVATHFHESVGMFDSIIDMSDYQAR